jgi:hypothetical protein
VKAAEGGLELNKDIMHAVIPEIVDVSNNKNVIKEETQSHFDTVEEIVGFERYATLGSMGGIDAAEIQFFNDFGVISRTPNHDTV